MAGVPVLEFCGGLKLLRSTFNNGPANSAMSGQAFPDTYPAGSHPALTGASETNTLGFVVPGVGVMDSVYRHLSGFPHTASSLVLNFQGAGLAGLTEESWGLDNVRVYLTPNQGPPRLIPLLFDAGGFTFLLQAEPGWTYVIQASTDLMNWAGMDTNRPGTNSVLYVDPAARTEGHRFYRALQQP